MITESGVLALVACHIVDATRTPLISRRRGKVNMIFDIVARIAGGGVCILMKMCVVVGNHIRGTTAICVCAIPSIEGASGETILVR